MPDVGYQAGLLVALVQCPSQRAGPPAGAAELAEVAGAAELAEVPAGASELAEVPAGAAGLVEVPAHQKLLD